MITRLTLRNLAAHRLRLGLTALAVVLGTAFVAGTLIFSSTTDKAFDELFSEGTHTVDVTVQGTRAFTGGADDLAAKPVPASVLDQVRRVDGVAEARGQITGFAAIVGRDGKVAGGNGPPQMGIGWPSSLSDYTLVSGRGPTAPHEVALDSVTAEKTGYATGDQVKVVTKGPAEPYEVVGVFKVGASGRTGGVTYTAFEPATAQRLLAEPGAFSGIVAKAANGVSPAELAGRVNAVVPAGFEAITAEQAADDAAGDVKELLGFLSTFLLTFGVISVFVGSFIIFNTFSMLVAQRTRDLALLRAVGASRRQVTLSVMGEALGVGLLGSIAGLLAGAGLAVGLRGLFSAMGADLPTTALVIAPSTVVWTLAVGVAVTLVAAFFPARRAARTPPVAALRDGTAPPARSLRARAVTGGLFAAAGGALLATGLAGDAGDPLAPVGGGALLVFLAVAMLSPLFARPVTRLLGAPLVRLFGTTARLGSGNAQRNPRRTSATAAALMIGMALIATVSVLAASMTASIDKALDGSLGADFQVSAGGGFGPPGSFDPSVSAALAAVPGVKNATPMTYAQVRLGDQQVFAAVGDPEELAAPFGLEMKSGTLAADADEILVDARTAAASGWTTGSSVRAQYADGAHATIRIAGVFADNPMAGPYLLGEATHAAHYPDSRVSTVLVVKEPGADAATVRRGLEASLAAYPNLTLQDRSDIKEQARASVGQLLTMISALLVLSILIAVLGIINTLALSVIERTREIGLLRAVGMGRRQLRRMIRYESVLISVFGALLGIAVGIGFGWAVQRALADQGIDVLSVPAAQLGAYLAAAALVGVLAAAWPARRAARMDVLRAIAAQ
ncbi:ABC transporter permease [Planotetraspora kaengkrachanensis]|uniref:ABC transporter n=1 Tax=Planotetraspora kaengkrachanensis TaxID=575193 RepID=A0A8J3Q088_9ACTN|nr:ABC transporter permease [Planotetraspora kaengkrachanensis]GIG84345.1 ABC transporter [Planotetraspora kaengkrachanensis]